MAIVEGKINNEPMADHDPFLDAAFEQAMKSASEGGIPIGALLVANYEPTKGVAPAGGDIVAVGHNQRVQSGDPTAHAEVECIRDAGRRRDWNELTLYTTLSPCVMCAGTAILLRIPQICIGENRNFKGDEDYLRRNGVQLTIFNDDRCTRMMRDFIAGHLELWNEDIGIPASSSGPAI